MSSCRLTIFNQKFVFTVACSVCFCSCEKRLTVYIDQPIYEFVKHYHVPSKSTIFQRWYKVNVHKPVIIAIVYNLISQSSFVALLWIFSIEMDCLFSYMPTACRFYTVVVQCALVILTVPPFTTLSGIVGSAVYKGKLG